MKGDPGEAGLPGLPGEDAFVPIDYIKRKLNYKAGSPYLLRTKTFSLIHITYHILNQIIWAVFEAEGIVLGQIGLDWKV